MPVFFFFNLVLFGLGYTPHRKRLALRGSLCAENTKNNLVLLDNRMGLQTR